MQLRMAIIGGFLLGACGDSLSVDVAWLVKTPCASVNCPPARSISASVDDDGYDINCELIGSKESSGLLLSAKKLDGNEVEYGIELRNGLVVNNEFVGGDECVFKVIEGNQYEGACGTSAPSEDSPCQVSNFAASSESISLNILCQGLPLPGTEQQVSVIAPTGISQPLAVTCKNL